MSDLHQYSLFQSTSSARRTTWSISVITPSWLFQSTSSARRTTFRRGAASLPGAISIHVLREEDDGQRRKIAHSRFIFQSTSSARRTTAVRREGQDHGDNFNPRPPRGGRPDNFMKVSWGYVISIHVLREEDDDVRSGAKIPQMISIHVLREEDDVRIAHAHFHFVISIHVLREEDDERRVIPCTRRQNFNPRPPRGGRRCSRRTVHSCHRFQSTSSARRTTDAVLPPAGFRFISIHVLREEDDPRRGQRSSAPLLFQSTSSARRTTAKVHKKPVHLLRKRYNHFPAGRCNPPYSGKTETSTFNSLAIKC